MSDLVLIQSVPPVAVLTLNRPERHNSLVPALLEQLLDALDQVGHSAGLRAVVLQANGRSFSTGGDLRGFQEHLAEITAYSQRLVNLLNQAILAMIALPVPARPGAR